MNERRNNIKRRWETLREENEVALYRTQNQLKRMRYSALRGPSIEKDKEQGRRLL
jgi:hypothetical protein